MCSQSPMCLTAQMTLLASIKVPVLLLRAAIYHSALTLRLGLKKRLNLKAHRLLAVCGVIHNVAFLILADVVHMHYVTIHGHLGIAACTINLPSTHRHVIQDVPFVMPCTCRAMHHQHRHSVPSKISLSAALGGCLPCRSLMLQRGCLCMVWRACCLLRAEGADEWCEHLVPIPLRKPQSL